LYVAYKQYIIIFYDGLKVIIMPLFATKSKEPFFDPKSHPFGFIANYTNRFLLGVRGFKATIYRKIEKTGLQKIIRLNIMADITYVPNTLKIKFSIHTPLIPIDLSKMFAKLQEMFKQKHISFVMESGEALCLVFKPEDVKVVLDTLMEWMNYIDKELEKKVRPEGMPPIISIRPEIPQQQERTSPQQEQQIKEEEQEEQTSETEEEGEEEEQQQVSEEASENISQTEADEETNETAENESSPEEETSSIENIAKKRQNIINRIKSLLGKKVKEEENREESSGE